MKPLDSLFYLAASPVRYEAPKLPNWQRPTATTSLPAPHVYLRQAWKKPLLPVQLPKQCSLPLMLYDEGEYAGLHDASSCNAGERTGLLSLPCLFLRLRCWRERRRSGWSAPVRVFMLYNRGISSAFEYLSNAGLKWLKAGCKRI